ncbi:CoA transferase [Amycolatopsis acidicola]|uniref:CoA transferase n=1 Tax=Amycolatopsis acidicola TaxID=2596893 RepID=A0A5N0VEE3_9PSEU|nr:CoA transferase [Amycolatopsis acidicola]KAA9163998.1 CoA transferase [Amycolatopsis acidicola]
MNGPFSGLKVVELAEMVSGPYCGKLLADFDAEVIKVERPEGDPARRRGPFLGDDPDQEKSGLFLYLNTNKRGVTLDLADATGRTRFLRLIADADVLIEDRAPGELSELGLGYDDLSAVNPGLVMVSITPFGQDGPYRDRASTHLTTYHSSGQGYMLPMMSENLDREPVRGPGYLGEYDAGSAAAIAVLSALFWRDGGGGSGQHIDISKQHAMAHLERSQLRRYLDSGVSPNRTGMGRLLESLVRCKDGIYVILILSSEHQWQGLFRAMGRPEWAREERFATQASRSEHYPELRERLAEWAATLTSDEVFHLVQNEKSACAPAQTAETFHASEQTRARQYFLPIAHPVTGVLEYPGWPYRFSGVEWRPTTGAPLLGQHNDEVLDDSRRDVDYEDQPATASVR